MIIEWSFMDYTAREDAIITSSTGGGVISLGYMFTPCICARI